MVVGSSCNHCYRCALRGHDGFRYFHLLVTGGGDTPQSLEHLYSVYRQMIDDNMERLLDQIKVDSDHMMIWDVFKIVSKELDANK